MYSPGNDDGYKEECMHVDLGNDTEEKGQILPILHAHVEEEHDEGGDSTGQK